AGLRGKRLLEFRPRRQTFPVRADVGMLGTDHSAHAGRHQEVPHHDVGAGELSADQILLAGEPVLEHGERVLGADATVVGNLRNALGLGKEHGMARDVANRRERCRFGEVHPLKIRARSGLPTAGASRPFPYFSIKYSRIAPDSNNTKPSSSIAGNFPVGVDCSKEWRGGLKATVASSYGMPSSSSNQRMRIERVNCAW